MNLETIETLEEENQRLKRKVNQLIDQVIELQKQGDGQDIRAPEDYDTITVLGQMFRKIADDALEIQPKKGSKKDKEFLKVSRQDVERILVGLLGTESLEEIANIYAFIAACGVIKVQASGKIYWRDSVDGKSIDVLLFRRSAYRYFTSR